MITETFGLRTADYDYYLPPERIAQTPIEPRDASRLMVVSRRESIIAHCVFRDIGEYLRPGDVLVCNESRVIPARLYGRKRGSGGQVEALLLAKRGGNVWEALLRPGRRLREGTVVEFGQGTPLGTLCGTIGPRTMAGGRLIEFGAPVSPPAGPATGLDLQERLEALGVVPLPPYIHTHLDDPERYQTVYARIRGSVAAPTAGLHFTPELLARLRAELSVEFAFVTLHIGLDTFRPVQVENVTEHKMHSEYCELSLEVAQQLNAARREGRRIVAVGTTSVRVLESAGQAALRQGGFEVFVPFHGPTDIFIYPGYRFLAVDALLTNFHLPRSTLLMLVAAFAGQLGCAADGKALLDRVYSEAIENEYRFYSFGDAMLLE